MAPQPGKQAMGDFQNEVFWRQGIARVEFSGDLGGVAFHPHVDASSPCSALSGLPVRHGPHQRTVLDQAAKPGRRPPLETASPDQSLNVSLSAGDDGMADFTIRVKNTLQFSNCEAPHIPTSRPYEEVLIVALRGYLLTITEHRADGGLGSRIYAQRAIDLPALDPPSPVVAAPDLAHQEPTGDGAAGDDDGPQMPDFGPRGFRRVRPNIRDYSWFSANILFPQTDEAAGRNMIVQRLGWRWYCSGVAEPGAKFHSNQISSAG
jgi:hypothetical protein